MCDFIGFTSYINTGPQSQIAIDNRSEVGWEMVSVTYDFTPQFDIGIPDKQLSPGVYGLETQVTAEGTDSFQGWSISGQSMTWTFMGMHSQDGAGWKLGLGSVRGSEINGTTITATFRNAEQEEQVAYTFAGQAGNGVSFNASASVPEPSGLALIGMLAAVFVARWRGR